MLTNNQSFPDFIGRLKTNPDTGAIKQKIMETKSPLLRRQCINPHSPDLTQDQKIEIFSECKANPWYFFREVYMVYRNGEWINLLATYNTLGAISAIEQSKDFFSVAQTRSTLGIVTMMRHYYPMINSFDSRQTIFVPAPDAVSVLVKRFMETHEQVPDYISGDMYVSDESRSEGGKIVYKTIRNPSRNNELTVVCVSGSKDEVSNATRPLGVDVVTFDTSAHIQHFPMMRRIMKTKLHHIENNNPNYKREFGYGFNYVHSHFAVDDGFPGHESHWRELKIAESFLTPFRIHNVIQETESRGGYSVYDYHLSEFYLDAMTQDLPEEVE